MRATRGSTPHAPLQSRLLSQPERVAVQSKSPTTPLILYRVNSAVLIVAGAPETLA